MPPVSKRIVSPKIKKNIYELLVHSFSKARGEHDLLPFISDLLTLSEQTMVSKRLAIAFLLLRKDYDYRQIARTLKVSTATVARVNVVLSTQGAGYRNILSKTIKDENIKVILGEIYDLFTPPRGMEGASWKTHRKFVKRDIKSF